MMMRLVGLEVGSWRICNVWRHSWGERERCGVCKKRVDSLLSLLLSLSLSISLSDGFWRVLIIWWWFGDDLVHQPWFSSKSTPVWGWGGGGGNCSLSLPLSLSLSHLQPMQAVVSQFLGVTGFAVAGRSIVVDFRTRVSRVRRCLGRRGRGCVRGRVAARCVRQLRRSNTDGWQYRGHIGQHGVGAIGHLLGVLEFSGLPMAIVWGEQLHEFR